MSGAHYDPAGLSRLCELLVGPGYMSKSQRTPGGASKLHSDQAVSSLQEKQYLRNSGGFRYVLVSDQSIKMHGR